MDILFALVGVGVLLIILYIVPVGYNKKGNLYLVGAALLIALTTHYANVTFQWWQGGLILILLSFLMTILLSRNLESYKLASEGADVEGSSETNEYHKQFDDFVDDIDEDNESDLIVDKYEEKSLDQAISEQPSEDSFISESISTEDQYQTEDSIPDLAEEDVDFIEERIELKDETETKEQEQAEEEIMEWETIEIQENETIISPEEELIANRVQENNEDEDYIVEPQHDFSSLSEDDEEADTPSEFEEEEFLFNRNSEDTDLHTETYSEEVSPTRNDYIQAFESEEEVTEGSSAEVDEDLETDYIEPDTWMIPVVEEEDVTEEHDEQLQRKQEDVLEETEEESTLQQHHQQKTTLQTQMLHTFIKQIQVQEQLMSPQHYEMYLQEFLNDQLPAQDYYTFATLLLQHYVKHQQYSLLEEKVLELKEKFNYSPIIVKQLEIYQNKILNSYA